MTNRSNVKSTTQPPQLGTYRQLIHIGISKLSADCYGILNTNGDLEVSKIATLLNKPYRSIYRAIHDLQKKGFVIHVYTGHHPYKYQAILLSDALPVYAKWQEQQVHQLITEQELNYLERLLGRL